MSGSPVTRDMYELKPVSYYGNPRTDYVELLPDGKNLKILEIGCGDGATGVLAQRMNKCAEYIGVEMFESAAEKAKDVLTNIHIGNVETMVLPYPPEYFDVLIASEVLEHLVDPYEAVKRLTVLVKPGGLVLASSPNISWYQNILALIKGRFDYTEEGMMDRTHLRWFTPSSFAAMFVDAGIRVDRLAPFIEVAGKKAKLRRLIAFFFGQRFDHIWWYQINLHGTKL